MPGGPMLRGVWSDESAPPAAPSAAPSTAAVTSAAQDGAAPIAVQVQTETADQQKQELEVQDHAQDGAKEAPVKHLVIDSGAIISLENLFGKAEEFWTVREVLAEIRDKQARRALETLPFDLKVREPSDEALAAVVDFAKKTGDLSVLSKPDIRIIALTYMLHKETHGVSGLRLTPLRPGSSANTAATVSEGGQEDGSEVDHEPAPKDASGEIASLKPRNNKVIPLKSNNVAKTGVSWAAALGKAKKDSEDAEETLASSQNQDEGTSAVPKDSGKLDPSSMWGDDDFATFDDGPGDELENPTIVNNVETEQSNEDNKAEEMWPSLDASRDAAEAERVMQTREATEMELREVEAKEKRKLERRQKKLEKKLQAEKEAAEEEEDDELEAAPKSKIPAHLAGSSRILGISGVMVDTGELEGEGWVTPGNLHSLDPADAMKTLSIQGNRKEVTRPTISHQVACITTDYAMQNVMLQMKLRLMTIEGRAVTTIRRFVLKCDACGTMTKKLDKKFCPSCGNPTLGRLNYSISPDGVLSYHYKKNRQINTRGMRYSMPKPKGGRTGDLLLSEDQLLAGFWSQHANKKSSDTSMFGEHVTESLGLKLSGQSDGIRIGYGRQNPNSAKGRERRGKKKKRSEKRPGFL